NGSKATKLELNFTKKLTNYLDNGGDPDTLIGDIKEKLRTLGGELTKIEAIQRLQSTKDKEQKRERKKVKMTLAEIEAQENLLTNDPSWQTDLKEKVADIVQRDGINERFKLHVQHTKEIKDLYRNFLDEKDLPVTEVAKVGRFSIVELVAQQHLVAESDSQDHCVGTATGYRNGVKN
ncbi:MAG: hypothetical protein LBO09_08390, partial [Candidatus Peribacteria bacterium]|nr:hypothetical protein [Candidatus Peribacteria bacterium]